MTCLILTYLELGLHYFLTLTRCVGSKDLSFEVRTGVRQGGVTSILLGHKMDPFFYARGPRLRRRGPIILHSTTHLGGDRPAQHVQQLGQLDDLVKVDGSSVC